MFFSKDLLGQFQCPFEGPNDQRCPSGILCDFGHRNDPFKSAFDTCQYYRPLPPWICVNHLQDKCFKISDSVKERGVRLKRCSDGYHPKEDDLRDIDRYERDMAQVRGCPMPGATYPMAPPMQPPFGNTSITPYYASSHATPSYGTPNYVPGSSGGTSSHATPSYGTPNYIPGSSGGSSSHATPSYGTPIYVKPSRTYSPGPMSPSDGGGVGLALNGPLMSNGGGGVMPGGFGGRTRGPGPLLGCSIAIVMIYHTIYTIVIFLGVFLAIVLTHNRW